jgi:tetratricopeptide (TPR) repeat protein
MGMTRNRLFCLVISLLILLAYSNSFQNSLQYDDYHVIERNPFIKDPSRIPDFFLNPQLVSGLCSETSSYRPLLMASLAFNYSLGGLNVFGYHLLNFLVHLICALLVYFVTLYLFRFGSEPSGTNTFRFQLTALFAALIFGLHPIQTESVTYISSRSSSMAALFYLASFFAYLQYILTGKIRYLVFSSAAYVGTLLVKETGITLLAILFLFNLMLPHGRSLKSRYLSLLPHFLLSLVYLGIRVYFFASLSYSNPPVRSFYDHVLTQLRAWVYYLGTLVLPLNLNVDYDFPVSHSFLENEVILSLFLLVGLVLLILWLSRSNQLIGFGALWFAINLAPTNSLIVLEDLIADRWLYLPSVGFAILMAYGVSWIYQTLVEGRSRVAKVIFFFSCALTIELYGYSTLLRNFDWTSQRTLWEDAVAKSPNKARTYNGLGLALLQEDRLEEASQYFQQAITLEPKGGQAYLNLGYVYSLQGDYDKAIEYYEQAIPLNQTFLADVYNNLGVVYLEQQRMEEAKKYFIKAIEIRPHDPRPYCNLGAYHEKKGEIDQAIHFYETSAKLAPEIPTPHGALSILYERKGWKEKSKEAYHKFLKNSAR